VLEVDAFYSIIMAMVVIILHHAGFGLLACCIRVPQTKVVAFSSSFLNFGLFLVILLWNQYHKKSHTHVDCSRADNFPPPKIGSLMTR
jgi:hypothetical protein